MRAQIEAAAPLVGDLVIRDLPATGNSWRRHVRCAELLDNSSPQARTLSPALFDPPWCARRGARCS